MTDTELISEMQSTIDLELHSCLESLLQDYPIEYVAMFNYQMGWEGEKAGREAQGKRIRPLLVLLACHACGGKWQRALPAAAAVELVHNFSLIHDDIQDRSEMRRGRQTVWMKWGEAQAINAGDAMLTVAQLSVLRLSKYFTAEIVHQAIEILQYACLKLTRGQHLDIAFEDQEDLPLEFYWQMIEGKTSALLSACLEIGTLLGGADEKRCQAMTSFGSRIGAAFQVQDDWLGIWGDDEIIGKSTSSDLVTRKKTYPVLLGIQNGGTFAQTWKSMKTVKPTDAQLLAGLLEAEGIQLKTQRKFDELYNEGFIFFNQQKFEEQKSEPLRQVIEGLFGRIK